MVMNVNLTRALVRGMCSRSPTEIEPGYFKIKNIQEHFLQDNKVPVFLKGSAMDNVLYRLTMGLCIVAIGSMGAFFYDIANPRKN